MPRFIGLFAAFAAVLTIIAFSPGAQRNVVAQLQSETPTDTTVADTATSTVTTSATASPTATTTPGPSRRPQIEFPDTTCVGGSPFFPTSANVTFEWAGPTNVSAIFLDLSIFDNFFADGTYITVVLAPGTREFTWNGLQPGIAHHWRVTGLGLDGNFVMSDFGRFTPCGTQRLLNINYSCTGGGRANVEFRWAPSSSPGFFQFVDLSLFNNGFAPNTFLGSGPHAGEVQGLVWPGILANTLHFFRVNTFTLFGWSPSQTGTFVAQC
jgi:hypothetical protein